MNQNGSESKPVAPEPVAIIGMSCLFPKADGVGRYWANIRDCVDAISEVPPTHWRAEDYFDPDPKAADRTYARRGGFLSPVDFPALEFGIAPNNLEATDTTQLLGLLAARQALEDAGYGPGREFNRERVSVILGVTGTLELVIPLGARLGHPIWRRALKEAGVADDTAETVVRTIADSYVGWQENSFPGLLGNVAAGRIANRLDLGGTNCVIDAACASSLGALNLALLELAAGRSDMVLTGGVDTFNDIFMYMCFSKTPALSPTGDARPFDGTADGTILGEGLGVLVLKRLADARRDGDRVYAVIRSVGSSSDGKGSAVYAPKAEGQAKALRQAYGLAGITPDTIELVEAHGTGTKVGDATELAALTEVYRESNRQGSWCTLGSVKSQIGHTKAAAGAAGLIKAALALHHKVLPPTAKIGRPAEGLKPGESPFVLSSEPRPWLPSSAHPRRAAVSAFGFGGSNFHCVLEEADALAANVDWDGDVQIAAFSAPSTDALHRALDAWKPGDGWAGVCAAAARSRATFRPTEECRLLLVFDRSDDLPRRLRDARKLVEGARSQHHAATADGTFFGRGGRDGLLAVLFPGQGSQYVGMLRELSCRFPAVASVLAEADADDNRPTRLSDAVYPPTAYDDGGRAAQEAALRATETAQPAIGAVSLGALSVLEHFGVRPDLVAGHSFGELTALCAAGRIAPDAFHHLARLRGRLMADGAGERGTMLAVLAPTEQVEPLIASERLDVVVANRNGPRQLVLSGPSSEIERAATLCAQRGIDARRLPVSAAFHSRFVAAASGPLADALRASEFAAARIPVFANTTATPYPDDAAAARALLAGQLANPVEFMAEVGALHDFGARFFLEVGPDARLTGLVRSILDGRAHQAVALDASRGRRGNLTDLARALAALAAAGYPVELARWQEGVGALTETPPTKPGLTVKVCGANKAAQPPRTAAPAPKESGPLPSVAQPSASSPEVAPAERRNGIYPESPMTHSNGEPRHRPKTNGAPSTPSRPPAAAATLAPVPLGPANSTLLAQALKTVQDNLLALQAIGVQTSEVHRQFLEGQDRAQLSFQALLEQQQRLTCAALGLAPMEATPISSALNLTPPAPSPAPVRSPEPARARSAPAPTPAPNGHSVAPARAPAPAPVNPAPPAAARTPEVNPRHVPPARTASPSARQTTQRALIDVVAEKTGYPAEMLEPAMQLDADLGIDSIKRVEILSAIQERLPDAPVVGPEHLGTLRTLADIVDFLAQGQGHGRADAVPAAAPANATADASAVQAALIDVVAEKTGYPAEMLEPAMQLDADLGIDSIKRVEILSAIQERLPDAPVVGPEHLGTLRTLADIVDFLAQGQGHGRADAGPAAAPANATTDAGAVQAALIDVVAEKTGYPAEMLEPAMQLDADLGIDSIKRVEILSAIQERLPDAPVVGPEHLGTLRTLADIVDFLAMGQSQAAQTGDTSVAGHASGNEPRSMAAGADRSTETGPPAPAGESLVRLVPCAVPLEDASGRDRVALRRGAEIWVADDGSALTGELVDALKARGFVTRVIGRGEATSAPVPERLDGLVLLASAGDDAHVKEAFRLLHHTAPALRRAAQHGAAVLAAVTRLDGAFGFLECSPDVEPACGALAGLAKTAAHEWPEVSCKSIDVAPDWDDAARTIADELSYRGPVEVGLAPGRITTVELVPSSVPVGGANPTLAPGDVLVVTGGARGVTAEVALAFARAFRPTVVLLGRSPDPEPEPPWLAGLSAEAEIKRALATRANGHASPQAVGEQFRRVAANREIVRNLDRIQAAGARVVYRSVDVRDAAAVRACLAGLQSALGPVRGVVHGAGVLADRRIEDQSDEQFAQVYDTKVLGLRNILGALSDVPLKLLALFSSSTARFGRNGQVAYAAANEVLNKTAQREAVTRPGCRVVSVNWGPWDGGMVTDVLKPLFTSEGIGLIPLRAGAEYLVNELGTDSHDHAVEVVVLGPGSVIQPAAKPERRAAAAPELAQVFEREVTVESVPVLDSHVIDGRPVLPLALTLEWLAQGAAQRNPGLLFAGLGELRLLKGVVIRASQPETLRVLAGKAVRRDNVYAVPVELAGRFADGTEVAHARGEVLLAERHTTAKPSIGSLELPHFGTSVEEVYRDTLFHGPRLHGVERIEGCGESGIAATVATNPAPTQWIANPLRHAWLSDPLAIDCAFQLMVLWCAEVLGAGSLPTRLAGYSQFRKGFPAGGVRVAARVLQVSQHKAIAEIEFLDDQGGLVARIDEYECVIDASLNDAFRRNQAIPITPR